MALRVWVCGLAAATLLSPGLAAQPSVAEPDIGSATFRPSHAVARQRGPEIFNAVHNAMRQWGSSLHHNGMSVFLGTVPEGVLFHHGNSNKESPTEPDWLAYEIEHAENFAHSRRGHPGGPPGRTPPSGPPPGEGQSQQHVFSAGPRDAASEDDDEEYGYLHVYRTTQTMQFLYVDGMSAGKTSMGTLDSQDLLLRGLNSSGMMTMDDPSSPPPPGAPGPGEPGPGGPGGPGRGGPMGEGARAADLCKLCDEWGLQGIIRMEAGFEIIKCDFSVGMEEIQALPRPETKGGHFGFQNLETMRGLSERYQGIGGSRTIIDFSSMVSAFFFPLNVTNFDPKRPDLPRLANATQDQLSAVRHYLAGVIEQRRGQSLRKIDWQGVSDMIVGRYADRIKYMAEHVESVQEMAYEVNFLLGLFVDGSGEEEGNTPGIERCADFYLKSVSPVTEADELIHTAFRTVTLEVCTTLFRVRDLVVENRAPDQSSLAASLTALLSLRDYLHWARFKRCPPCAINEVCFIPMWPIGTVEDYNTPRCTNGSDSGDGESYWGGRRPGGGGRGERPPPF